jgi:LuxR family maltose regulon positive regulatory protein
LSASLRKPVTGNTASQDMLEHLDRANLFLVALDGTRRWYRYHHLFAEVLSTHLLEARPEEVGDLHRRASRWYDEAGDPAAAVRHALAAGDIDRAADLAELAVPALQRGRQEATICRVALRFPGPGRAEQARAGAWFHRCADVQRSVR